MADNSRYRIEITQMEPFLEIVVRNPWNLVFLLGETLGKLSNF